MKAEEVRPLLPALVHLARFPTCNLRVICERWGVGTARVMAAVADAERDAGDAGGFGDELLERAAKRWRVSLPAWQVLPAGRPASAVVRKLDRRPLVGLRVVVPEPSPVPPEVVGRPRSRRWEYAEVLRLIAAGDRETVACKRAGLSLASWRYFRESRGLGRRGAMDAVKVRAIRRELKGASK